MDKQKTAMILAAGATALLTAGYFFMTRGDKSAASARGNTMNNSNAQQRPVGQAVGQATQEEMKGGDDVCDFVDGVFTDPSYDQNKYLTKIEAENRSEFVSDVSYTLIMGMVKGGKTYNGKISIDYTLSRVAPAYTPDGDNSKCLFIDYKGKEIRSITVNGTRISANTPNLWLNHRIYIPVANQAVGVNRTIIEFETYYVTDCQGFQYFKDDTDGEEYIYTELEPDYCHIVFPCFDQPDLKANHKSCIIAPSDWACISNSSNIFESNEVAINSQDQEYRDALQRFDITADSPIVTAFGDTKIKVHEFERTKKISTYLFAFVLGSFDALSPTEERDAELPHLPMKFYCRKSLTQYAQKMTDDWFRITKASIRFYEQMFDTPYPFDKIDSVMCPDYAMGAMENVGCITYNDDYIPRDENFTRYKQENIFNTIAHEVSHQWFGNLVTMKWWDDLWLNESFANMISYMALDGAQGCEDVTLAWNIFLDEQYWGLAEDQKNTSHPIAAEVANTGVAQDIFDGISYGKGAAFLHQMIFYLGTDVLKEGLKTYFKKYSFKNTVLDDFIAELSDASTRLGLQVNFREWSDSWLRKAGCSEIEITFDRSKNSEGAYEGEFSNMKLVQKPYNVANIQGNQLRVQAFNITSLDDDMKVIDVHRVETSATQSETVINKFCGPQAKNIRALLINQAAHGYGKFAIDDCTMQAFWSDLHAIESSLDRKLITNMMYDNVKSGKLPASRVLKIVLNNIEKETAFDVIQDTLGFISQALLKNYHHDEGEYNIEYRSGQLFNATSALLKSGTFNDYPAAMESLVSNLIGFSSTKKQHEQVAQWFLQGKIWLNLNDRPESARALDGTSVNVKLRHTMIRKLFGSQHLPKELKKECFAMLAQLDKTDMIGRTEKFCEAADPNPDSKREAFMNIFENMDLGLQQLQEMCRGFRQSSQKELIATFADDFFERIEDCVNNRAWSNTRYIYLFLVPTMQASDAELARLNALKDRLEGYTEAQKKEGTDRLIKWVRESIQEVEEKKASRAISKQYQDTHDEITGMLKPQAD